MITCGDDGKVIVRLESESFDLSIASEYADFVLRLTSPDESILLDESDYKIDDELDGDNRAKAERYSAFICDFLARRKEKLDEDRMLTTEKREASIKEFIEHLKKGDE